MVLRSLAANSPSRRANWKALGLSHEDMLKPKIAVVNSSSELAICYAHLDSIAKIVKEEIRAAGGVPFEVRTAAPSDFITGAGKRGSYGAPDVSLAPAGAAGVALARGNGEVVVGDGESSSRLRIRVNPIAQDLRLNLDRGSGPSRRASPDSDKRCDPPLAKPADSRRGWLPSCGWIMPKS